MAKLGPGDIKYLTFQGAGGKGTVYGGPIALLEEFGLLPMIDRESDPPRDYSPIQGVSGSSAGAITAFSLALGIKLEDLNRAIDEKHYGRFFEDPVPGLYKAVRYIKNYSNSKLGILPGPRNVPGYAVDTFEKKKTLKTVRKKSGKAVYRNRNVAKVTRFFENLDDAKKCARTHYKAYKRNTNQVERYFINRADSILDLVDDIGDILDIFRTSYETEPEEWWSNLKKDPTKFIYSLLYDRGLLSGIEVRNYFNKLLYLALQNLREPVTTEYEQKFVADDKIFNKDVDKVLAYPLNEKTAGFVTFKELYEITGKHLVIVAVNIVNKYPCEYSHELTPDYPVVDAVCASMSIPIAFKPTFSDAKVNFSKNTKYRNELNFLLRHNGFILDGGALNNLPIHAFDHLEFGREQREFIPPLRQDVLAFGMREGYPLFEDIPHQARNEIESDIDEDENYKAWVNSLNKEEQEKVRSNSKIVKDLEKFSALPADIGSSFDSTKMETLPNKLFNDHGGKTNTFVRELIEMFDDENSDTDNWDQKKRRFIPTMGLYEVKLTKLLGSLLHYIGLILGTVMYGTQDMKLRTDGEREQMVELFSYALTMLDFEPSADLRKFVQVRGANQLFKYFNENPPQTRNC